MAEGSNRPQKCPEVIPDDRRPEDLVETHWLMKQGVGHAMGGFPIGRPGAWEMPIGTMTEVPATCLRLAPPGPGRAPSPITPPYYLFVNAVASEQCMELAHELSRLEYYHSTRHRELVEQVVTATFPAGVLAVPMLPEEQEA